MITPPVSRGCKVETFNANGLKAKVQAGSKKRKRINVMLTLMRTHNIQILSVQEQHFSTLEENFSLDCLLRERDGHRVGGTITAYRGGMTLILSKQWCVMRYEQLEACILIVGVMDKSEQRLTVLAAHLSDFAEERQQQWRPLPQRSSSFRGHLFTLCKHNSLLFLTLGPHHPIGGIFVGAHSDGLGLHDC